MNVQVYGASDDQIEIEGAIREEFYLPSPDGEHLLAFSNGVVLRIAYTTSGVWRITPISGAEWVTIVQAPEDDDDNYSDRATVDGKVTWVVLGTQVAT